jgi:ABC-type sugar transport system ATPase subunit
MTTPANARNAEPGARGGTTAPALSLRGLSKRFGDAVVLDNVSLTVERGEVHALVGSNGSGKSTLLKVVTGVYDPTELEGMTVGGVEATFPITRRELQRLGVRVVHQALGLVDELSVAENVALSGGYVTAGAGAISFRRTRKLVSETLDRLGVEISPAATVGDLAAWQRVAVALARVFYGDLGSTRLVLLDEVTAAMPREEVSRLFDLVRRLTDGDVGVLYVTHRFEEIFAIAQRATAIRDGRVASIHAVSELTPAMLVQTLTGAAPAEEAQRPLSQRLEERQEEGVALRVQGVSAKVLRDIDLTARRGEILGVTGRAGCGKSELGRVLFGDQARTAGTIAYAGYDGPIDPRSLIAADVAFVPPDRKRQGLLAGGTVAENLTLPSLGRVSSAWWLDRRRERRLALEAIERHDVTPPVPEQVVDTLSGGNQQKVILGRWLLRDPRLIILDEPTEGVDVPARNEIYAALRTCAARGTSVLVLSSSAEEIVELCDRAVVLDEGRVVDELEGNALDVARLSHATSEGTRTHA